MALQVLLWLGVVLLVLIALIVILPVHIALSWQSDPVRRATILLRPFGGVSPAITVFDSTREHPPKPPRKRPRKHGKARRTWSRAPGGNVVAEAIMLVRRMLAAIHIDALRGDVEFGLGDPAETGQVYGQLCPLVYGAGANVQLRPNFNAACLRGKCSARVRLTLIGVAWPIVGFGWRVFGPLR